MKRSRKIKNKSKRQLWRVRLLLFGIRGFPLINTIISWENRKIKKNFRLEVIRLPKTMDLTGQRFGRLLVIKRNGTKGNKSTWLCKCDCGNSTLVTGSNLKAGTTKSCGCYRREYTSNTKGKHYQTKTRLYQIWCGIKERCFLNNTKTYEDYGGRGITICPEWLGEHGFENFAKWAYSSGYDERKNGEECSIDRIDVNGNYEPSNCKWSNKKEQMNNMRKNFRVEYKGKVKTLAQWVEELNLPYHTVYSRIKRWGWTVEKAFETPIRRK